MGKEIIPLDITDAPELERLAEEVHRTRSARVLRRNDVDLAIVLPVAPSSKQRRGAVKTQADYDAALASAGGWRGLVDTEQLKADIQASRDLSTKPPVSL